VSSSVSDLLKKTCGVNKRRGIFDQMLDFDFFMRSWMVKYFVYVGHPCCHWNVTAVRACQNWKWTSDKPDMCCTYEAVNRKRDSHRSKGTWQDTRSRTQITGGQEGQENVCERERERKRSSRNMG